MTFLRKPPFWATTLTVAGVGVLCTLGTWQLQRLAWKEGLIARINAYDENEMRSLSLGELIPENEFLKGRLEGRFEFSREIALKPRTHDGTPGVHIITPFILNNGNTILINRGWAPFDTMWSQHPAETVEVILRVPHEPNMFVPSNSPSQDEWYSLDVEQIAAAKNLNDPLPVVGYQLAAERGAENPYPNPDALTIRLNNNHLQYAVFWFTMALAMVAVFILRFIKPSGKAV